MSEIRKELKIYQVDYKCNLCNTGLLVCDEITLLNLPTRYIHKCNFCNQETELPTNYPKIITE